MNVAETLTQKFTSTNFEVREEGLSKICNSIIKDEMNIEGKMLILEYSINSIFEGIGKRDNIYVRSTFLGVIQCILEDNYEKRYISEDEMEFIYSKMFDYTKEEFVEIGYDEEYGMVNTLAQIADVFVTIFMYKEYCTYDRFSEYFEMITQKYCSKNYVFVTDEAPRIFRVFNYYFINSDNVESIIEFLKELRKTFSRGLDGVNQRQNYYNYLHILNYFTNDMELLRFIVSQLEAKYERYINEIL